MSPKEELAAGRLAAQDLSDLVENEKLLVDLVAQSLPYQQTLSDQVGIPHLLAVLETLGPEEIVKRVAEAAQKAVNEDRD